MNDEQGAQMQQKITEAMKQHPVGMITVPSKGTISAVFWDKNNKSEKMLRLNLLTGIGQGIIDGKFFTKAELMEELDVILKAR